MFRPDEKEDALHQSSQVQSAASSEGFDWPDVGGVLDKVDEEVQEIRQALASGYDEHARKELGDLLLITVNLARFLGADPREELLEATRRFANRFQHLKEALALSGKSLENCALEEIEMHWQQIKPDADKALRRGA